MLSRRIASVTTRPSTAAAGGLTSSSLVLSGARTYYNAAPDPIGKAHPDLMFGVAMLNYRGRGWIGFNKLLPMERFITLGGDSMTTLDDRHGHVQDPEDPRHPMVRVQFGGAFQKGNDNSIKPLVHAAFGPIPQSSRLLQVLYNNYLEPISCNRVCVPLMFLGKLPNNGEKITFDTIEYLAGTANLIGNVYFGVGSSCAEGVTIRGDTNQVIIHEGSQIMENVCMIADAPTTLHHYQRQETFNPYQTLEVSEGVVKIGMNTIVEPNCMIEACSLGTFNRIGHGSKILKGTTTSAFCHVLPGSVVLADTHMNEGEIWGGAPAQKLGKVSKFEYKKPWMQSVHLREMTAQTKDCLSYYGDQQVLWCEEMDKLDSLMVQFEGGVSAGVKAQIREFVEGREPYGHMMARITQGWTPANRADDKCNDHRVPSIQRNDFRNHNDDAESEYSGTIFNWKGYIDGGDRRIM